MTYDIGRMKWDMSNRKYLLLIKQTISDPIKGTIPECATAKEYLKRVESQFTGSLKAYASTLIKKLVTEKHGIKRAYIEDEQHGIQAQAYGHGAQG